MDRPTDQSFNKLLLDTKVNDKIICFLKTPDDISYTTVIHIIADQPTYRQPINVNPINKAIHFKYQLVTKADGNQVLKMDTTINENKAILNAYRKIPKVKIYNIPGFESTINFMSETDSVIALGNRNLTVHPVNSSRGDLLSTATEIKELSEAPMQLLEWNKMTAKPDSPVFSMDYIKNTQNHFFGLYIDGKKYDLASMRMTYFDGKNLNKAYHWSPPDTYPIEELKSIEDPFSVIIDRIIIRDIAAGLVYIPQAFIFNFE